MTGGSAAAQGISMLNAQRWGGAGNDAARPAEYSKTLEKDGRTLFEADIEEEEDGQLTPKGLPPPNSGLVSLSQFDITSPTPLVRSQSQGPTTPLSASNSTAQFDLLLSLDVALELIHADREALKRVETFTGYPGHYGHRVRDTIEEIFILVLQALGERDVAKGFADATERMKAYKPADNEGTANVAPLVQFFELVHVGDTIQSMVQVYFEKELAPHIDKMDFLNARKTFYFSLTCSK